MRGWSILNAAPNQDDAKRSVTVFEDALRIDPDNSQARVGLAHALTLIHRNRWDPDRARVLARADEAVTRAIALAPNYAHAHYVKAEVLALSRRFDAALATYDRAIALDPNHAAAYVARARSLIAIGRAAETVAPVEKAIRLSPRDPDLFVWYYVLCHAHTHLARDAQAIEWCLKSTATGKSFWGAWTRSRLCVCLARAEGRGGGGGCGAPESEAGLHGAALAQDGSGIPTIRRSARSSSGSSREHARPGCRNASPSPILPLGATAVGRPPNCMRYVETSV